MKRRLLYIFIVSVLICFVSLLFWNINKKQTVAFIGAMDDEISVIYDNLNNKKAFKKNNFVIITGTLGNKNIVLAKSGVGKVASSTTTQFIIDNYKPVYIINTGIAGSLSESLKAGDIIIADKMVQHDFDVSAFGNPKGYIDN